jgi:hypothetical protein
MMAGIDESSFVAAETAASSQYQFQAQGVLTYRHSHRDIRHLRERVA